MDIQRTLTSEQIVQVVSEQLGDAVSDVKPFTGRTNHVMYLAQWHQSEGNTPILIRFYEGVRGEDEMRIETGALRDLHRLGFPVPDLYLAEDDPSKLGYMFSVMELLPGEPLGELARTQPFETQVQWMDRASTLLLKLHRLDWQRGLDSVEDKLDHLDFADRQLKWWAKHAEVCKATHIADGYEWLQENKYITRRAKEWAIVHRDLHPNNMLAQGIRITGVVDWGEIALADPAIDVAWTAMILETEASAELSHNFVKTYIKHNPNVEATLDYWSVFSACKRLTTFAARRLDGKDIDGSTEQRVTDYMTARLTFEE